MLPTVVALLALVVSTFGASAESLQNITTGVPQVNSNQGDSQQNCTGISTTDIVLFFLEEYVAHTATIITLPGETLVSAAFGVLFAFLYPVSGVGRGLKAIHQAAVLRAWGRPSLEVAVKAGAVCEVVRTGTWRPQHGDIVRGLRIPKPITRAKYDSNILEDATEPNDPGDRPLRLNSAPVTAKVTSGSIVLGKGKHFLPENGKWDFSGRQVHGACTLPSGYALTIVPPTTKVYEITRPAQQQLRPQQIAWTSEMVDDETTLPAEQRFWNNLLALRASATPNEFKTSSPDIISEYSFPTGLLAFLQIFFASRTLYNTKGDEVDKYGYAAFGLTVAPYLIMSSINVIANILTPSYSYVYMVSSEVMEEALQRPDSCFEGVVGTLCTPQDADIDEPSQPFQTDASRRDFRPYTGKFNRIISAAFSISKYILARDMSEVKNQAVPLDAVFARQNDHRFLMHPLGESNRKIATENFGAPDSPGSYSMEFEEGSSDTGFIRENVYQPRVLRAAIEAIVRYGQYCASSKYKRRFQARLGMRRGNSCCLNIPSTSKASEKQIENVHTWRSESLDVAGVLVGCLSLAIVGGLSRFKTGDSSTKAQRVWTMTWLITGIISGLVAHQLLLLERGRNSYGWCGLLFWYASLAVFAVPAIGGFVVVWDMLSDYDECIDIS